jgi:hypothetical protein
VTRTRRPITPAHIRLLRLIAERGGSVYAWTAAGLLYRQRRTWQICQLVDGLLHQGLVQRTDSWQPIRISAKGRRFLKEQP